MVDPHFLTPFWPVRAVALVKLSPTPATTSEREFQMETVPSQDFT